MPKSVGAELAYRNDRVCSSEVLFEQGSFAGCAKAAEGPRNVEHGEIMHRRHSGNRPCNRQVDIEAVDERCS